MHKRWTVIFLTIFVGTEYKHLETAKSKLETKKLCCWWIKEKKKRSRDRKAKLILE